MTAGAPHPPSHGQPAPPADAAPPSVTASFRQRSLASAPSLTRTLSLMSGVHPSLLAVDVDDRGVETVGGVEAGVDVPHAAPSASAPQAASNLAISIAGFACASLPYAVATMSWPGVAAVVAAGVATAALSCHLVAELVVSPATGARHSTYAALTAAHLGSGRAGRAASEAIRALQAVACVGTCITSTIIGGQALKELLTLAAGRPLLPLGAWIGVFGGALAAATALPSMEGSWVLSMAGMAGFVVYATVMVAVSIADGVASPPRSYAPLAGDARPLPSDFASALYGVGVIVFAFGVGVSPEVAATLKPPVARRMHAATALTFSVIIPLFLAIAVAGYWGYGAAVKSVLIQSNALGAAAAAGAARRGVVALALVAVCVNSVAIYTCYSWPIFTSAGVLASALRRACRGGGSDRPAITVPQKQRLGNCVTSYLGRVAFVAATTLAAAALPFFADVASALGGVFLCQDYLFPPLFAAFSRERPRPSTPLRAAAVAVSAASAVLGALIVGSAIYAIAKSASTYRLFADM